MVLSDIGRCSGASIPARATMESHSPAAGTAAVTSTSCDVFVNCDRMQGDHVS